ncbi:HAD-IC family P-type ATPase [Puia sp. P3]|uniref:HAD-IC family P-type ATPase n=1 Tax=Puia sp. P3 TaxID=3423952 RepID=UPI003D668293
MLLGHWIEMRSVAGASRELELLVQLMPSEAHIIHEGGHVMDVKTDSLKAGDLIQIKPGEKVAADGIIAEGESFLNESMLTGESKPVHKIKGDKVIAGAINGNGVLKVAVQHGQEDSYLSKVIKLVDDAQKAKSKTQLLADAAAQWLTLIALLMGIATFVYWFIAGKDLSFAIERMVTVIVICCPHALGLAVPLVVAKSTALSAKNGLLIKNRTAFENSRRITTLVFDKTGTLTIGKFEVVRYQALRTEFSAETILQLAAAIEKGSEHPIATGVLQRQTNCIFHCPGRPIHRPLPVKAFPGSWTGKKSRLPAPSMLTKSWSIVLLYRKLSQEKLWYMS